MQMKSIVKLGGLLIGALLLLLSAFNANAQKAITASGTVSDKDGAPLPGVVVTVQGDRYSGTVTDGNGQFEIRTNEGATLQLSCLGYADAQVAAGKGLKVVMDESMQELDDVVVIGYGTAKKADLTGGVAVVGSKELNMVSTANLLDRLVGQVAGLSITHSDESPGSNQALLIRGQNSLSGSNSPLIILDGIPYDGSMADLDPNLIDNMTVLKDASSVAIYGSRGSNGVILIQTKKGTKGSLHVTYKGSYSLAEPMQRIQVMGPNEFIRLKQDLARLGTKQYTGEMLDPLAGDIISVSEKQNYAAGITNDWQDYVFRKVFNHDHQVSISGGNNRTTYLASVSYLDGDGVVGDGAQEGESLIGKAADILLSDIQAVLRRIKEELGFRHLFFNGILSDELHVCSRGSSGELVYNFAYTDRIFDFLRGICLLPSLSFSYMPSALASQPDRRLFSHTVSEPARPEEWNALIEAFMQHVIRRYGIRYVSQWRFSVWHQPNTSPRLYGFRHDEDFFELWRSTRRILKSYAPQALFGFPPVFQNADFIGDNWFFRMYGWCREHECLPDFLNY